MKIRRIVPLLLALAAGPAFADVNMEELPVKWRLQNYLNDGVNVYFTSSSCSQGVLYFSGSADDKNRFWATVMTSKINNHVVGIFYNQSTCQITSYYMKEG